VQVSLREPGQGLFVFGRVHQQAASHRMPTGSQARVGEPCARPVCPCGGASRYEGSTTNVKSCIVSTGFLDWIYLGRPTILEFLSLFLLFLLLLLLLVLFYCVFFRISRVCSSVWPNFGRWVSEVWPAPGTRQGLRKCGAFAFHVSEGLPGPLGPARPKNAPDKFRPHCIQVPNKGIRGSGPWHIVEQSLH
jgi:hypothetical protein